MVLGLMKIAREAYRVIRSCEKAYGQITEINDDHGSFGHFSDEIYNEGDVDNALEHEGIIVEDDE